MIALKEIKIDIIYRILPFGSGFLIKIVKLKSFKLNLIFSYVFHNDLVPETSYIAEILILNVKTEINSFGQTQIIVSPISGSGISRSKYLLQSDWLKWA